MFIIDDDKTIHLTRGDVAVIEVGARNLDGEAYNLNPGDVVRIQVFEKKRCDNVVLSKSVVVSDETTVVEILLTSEDTRFGEVISKPQTYWYEIEINPDSVPQTIVGYDRDGPKLFVLYPEGGDA